MLSMRVASGVSRIDVLVDNHLPDQVAAGAFIRETYPITDRIRLLSENFYSMLVKAKAYV